MDDAEASYPVRIDPTFSDADGVSLSPGLPGADSYVRVLAADSMGNLYAGGEFIGIGTVVATITDNPAPATNRYYRAVSP